MTRQFVFKADPLRSVTTRVFQASGAPADEALIVADHLITANLMGLDSHGLIRIPQYLEDIQKGIIRPGAPISLCQETKTTAIVECGWNFGQVGSVRAMEVAMAKATQYHTASVVVRHCNHAGRLGAFTQMAAEKGFLALGVCNSPRHGHFVLPWGGGKGRLATNPISFAVPGVSGDPILADFSTAESSEGKIRLYRNQGTQLPSGWIVDAEGHPSTDPADFYGPPAGAILPFGGAKGYRGFALSLLVEILGGLLGGSSTTVDQPGNGLGFVVIDISAFQKQQEFASLIRELHDYMKSSPPAEGFDEVILPGELDFKTRETRLRDGIPIDEKTWEEICTSTKSVGVKWNEELAIL
jgi:LDH2 family malate/lactate/ureidoglycolate dehydrogenase